ncbi:ABC transporter-like, ATP-binding domain [Dillenia turbinata]|uniref:ABC transporter-like, ATP-binding domain n=1 Tax=Dillenia turbinata TaxID=194707 RepID=A0AAN8UU05_9MAGN
MAAFVTLWQLATVELPFIVLLVVPGLMYGRAQMSSARKMGKEYSRGGIVAEQAISSISTVYSFVVENQLIRSLGNAMTNIKYLSDACSAIKHIMEVITAVASIDSYNMDGEILQNVSVQTEFRHVEFAYPSRPESTILRDFCLSIPAGKTAALIGSTGSGKSAIISLTQRHSPINKLQLKWLRSLMALVSQEPISFGGSIKDNILLGEEDATTDEVIKEAKASNAHHFVSELPQGYETQATSALDSESEGAVQEALNEAMICCTISSLLTASPPSKTTTSLPFSGMTRSWKWDQTRS